MATEVGVGLMPDIGWHPHLFRFAGGTQDILGAATRLAILDQTACFQLNAGVVECKGWLRRDRDRRLLLEIDAKG